MTYLSVFSDREVIIKKARLLYSRGTKDQAFSLLDNYAKNTANIENEIAIKLEKARILSTGDRHYEAEVLISKILYQIEMENISDKYLLAKAKQVLACLNILRQ